MGIDAQMFAKTRAKLTEDGVRRLSVDLVSGFGREHFVLWNEEPDPHHALELTDVYTQDGPDIVPAKGETFVLAHLSGRFYGPGYERGDLPTYIMVADWLERRIEGAEVWYGGDSSGVCAFKFDSHKREQFFAHFARQGNEPYESRRDVLAAGMKEQPVCGFCKIGMHACGFNCGPKHDLLTVYCPGCEEEWYAADGGRTLTPVPEDERLGTQAWEERQGWERALRELTRELKARKFGATGTLEIVAAVRDRLARPEPREPMSQAQAEALLDSLSPMLGDTVRVDKPKKGTTKRRKRT